MTPEKVDYLTKKVDSCHPSKSLGKRRKAVRRDRRADICTSVKYSRKSRNLSALDKSFGNDRYEHKVDSVHTGDDHSHHKHGNNDRICGHADKIKHSRAGRRADEDHSRAGNLVFEDLSVKQVKCREADNAENVVDAVAAVIILEDYLQFRKNTKGDTANV